MTNVALRETNSSPLKIGLSQKERLLSQKIKGSSSNFQPSIFRYYASFSSLSQWTLKKKSLNFIFPTKYSSSQKSLSRLAIGQVSQGG